LKLQKERKTPRKEEKQARLSEQVLADGACGFKPTRVRRMPVSLVSLMTLHRITTGEGEGSIQRSALHGSGRP